MGTPSETNNKITAIQEMVRRYVTDDRSLADELIADRRQDEMMDTHSIRRGKYFRRLGG